MYTKQPKSRGIGLWDPRVGNMTYPEPYLNPLRRIYPGTSKGSSYWGGSLSGMGSLGAFSASSAAAYNLNSAGRFGWYLEPSVKGSHTFSSESDPNLAQLVYDFQRTFMSGTTPDGKIGPRTLTAIAKLSADNPGPPAQSSPLLLAFIIKPRSGSQAEKAIQRGYETTPPQPQRERESVPQQTGPQPRRRSMSDGDEMNLDVAPPSDPKKSSVPMAAAIGGAVAIAAGLFFLNKKD